MSQLFQNYQESVNTLLFGTKAKTIKTTINVNEIIQASDVNHAYQKALKEI